MCSACAVVRDGHYTVRVFEADFKHFVKDFHTDIGHVTSRFVCKIKVPLTRSQLDGVLGLRLPPISVIFNRTSNRTSLFSSVGQREGSNRQPADLHSREFSLQA
jgi:hypothetical protein